MPLVLFLSSFSSISLPKHRSEHSWAVASVSTACGRLSKVFIWIRNTLFQATLPPLLVLNSAAAVEEAAADLIGGFWDRENYLTMSDFFTLITSAQEGGHTYKMMS